MQVELVMTQFSQYMMADGKRLEQCEVPELLDILGRCVDYAERRHNERGDVLKTELVSIIQSFTEYFPEDGHILDDPDYYGGVIETLSIKV